jgi:hypothetical protein
MTNDSSGSYLTGPLVDRPYHLGREPLAMAQGRKPWLACAAPDRRRCYWNVEALDRPEHDRAAKSANSA